jgi:hypothetical protein
VLSGDCTERQDLQLRKYLPETAPVHVGASSPKGGAIPLSRFNSFVHETATASVALHPVNVARVRMAFLGTMLSLFRSYRMYVKSDEDIAKAERPRASENSPYGLSTPGSSCAVDTDVATPPSSENEVEVPASVTVGTEQSYQFLKRL